MEEKEKNQLQDDNLWKIALGIVCFVILGYGLFYSKNTTTDLAYLVGYNLPFTLIIWGVFHTLVGKKRGDKIVGFPFLVIFISLIASDFIGYSQQKQEAKTALSEIKGQFSELIEYSTDAEGMPKRMEKPINTTPKARGEFGEIERFTKEFMDKLVSQRNDYLLELDAIGWNSILDAKRIKDDKTFVESKVTIQKAKEVVAKYTKQTQSLLEDTKDNIRSLNISEPSKSKVISSFDRGMEKTQANIDTVWSLEAKIIREFENIITLLSSKKGAWVVDGEQILFYNNSDLERFNTYIASIQNIVQQQESIQRQSIQTVNQNLDRLK